MIYLAVSRRVFAISQTNDRYTIEVIFIISPADVNAPYDLHVRWVPLVVVKSVRKHVNILYFENHVEIHLILVWFLESSNKTGGGLRDLWIGQLRNSKFQ